MNDRMQSPSPPEERRHEGTRDHDPAAGGVEQHTLAQAEGFKITYYEQKKRSNKLVITFDSINSGISSEGFGTQFILKNGYDTIFVAQKAKTQYQDLSIDQFHRAVKDVIGAKDVFTYGSSLGGYCALYYGGCVDATIIAAAPKNSALPEFLKPEFAGILKHSRIADVPRSSKNPVVLYDPYRVADDKMVKHYVLPAYPDTRIVELPFAGHTVLRPMQDSGILKSFLLNIIERDLIIPVKIEKSSGKTSVVYKHLLEEGDYLLRTGSVPEARDLMLKAIALHQTPKGYRILTRALIESGEMREAMASVTRGLDRFPGDAILLQLLQDLESREEMSRKQPIYKQLLRKLGLGGTAS